MNRNFQLVQVEDINLVKATYPNYQGKEFILAETGHIHLGFFTRSVRLATNEKILVMNIKSEKTFIELSRDDIRPFLDGTTTIQGFAGIVNKLLDPKGDNLKDELDSLEKDVSEKQILLDEAKARLEEDPDNEELKKAKQSAQGRVTYSNMQLKKFKEENKI